MEILLAILGILLSIVFFYITYIKTIGAKKERIQSINSSLVENMVKRIIFDDLYLEYDDIEELIYGISVESNLNRKLLHTTPSLLSITYSHIYSSDFIPSEQRKEILKKYKSSYMKNKDSVDNEIDFNNILNRKVKNPEVILALISVLFAGAISILFSNYIKGDSIRSELFISVGYILSTILIILIAFTVRLSRLTRASSEDRISNGIEFEEFLKKWLKRNKFDFEYIHQGPYDFEILKNNKKAVLEVKYTLKRVSHSHLNKIIYNLSKVIESKNIDIGYIVVYEDVAYNYKELSTESIKIVSFSEFSNIVKKEAI